MAKLTNLSNDVYLDEVVILKIPLKLFIKNILKKSHSKIKNTTFNNLVTNTSRYYMSHTYQYKSYYSKYYLKQLNFLYSANITTKFHQGGSYYYKSLSGHYNLIYKISKKLADRLNNSNKIDKIYKLIDTSVINNINNNLKIENCLKFENDIFNITNSNIDYDYYIIRYIDDNRLLNDTQGYIKAYHKDDISKDLLYNNSINITNMKINKINNFIINKLNSLIKEKTKKQNEITC